MDIQQKIYLLQTDDSDKFVITKTIDFSGLNILQDIQALRKNDWVRFHLTERALSIGNKRYNLAKNQSIDVMVPKTYIGQEK